MIGDPTFHDGESCGVHRVNLFVFSGFVDYSQSVLAAIQKQAFMGIESSEKLSFGFDVIRQGGAELQAASLTHAQVRTTAGGNETEPSFRHKASLLPKPKERRACANQTAPLPAVPAIGSIRAKLMRPFFTRAVP